MSQDREIKRSLKELFKDIPEINTGYIVGGAARDILLGKVAKDYDIALPREKIDKVIKKLKTRNISIFCLDSKRNYYRVIINYNEKNMIQLDITSLVDNDIYKDLSKRDFTINSMALPINFFLSDEVKAENYIDPYHGKKDLESKSLRAVSSEIFYKDPVRIIRCFRFISYGYIPENNLYKLMEDCKEDLRNISPNRIYHELFLLLEYDLHGFTTLKKMQELNLWELILPGGDILEGVIDKNVKDINNSYLIKQEKWFKKLGEFIKAEGFNKDDAIYFKWLFWWTLIAYNTYDKEIDAKGLIERFNQNFPVMKWHKKLAKFFGEGLSVEYRSRNLQEVERELEKVIVKKIPSTQKEEKALVFGQMIGMRTRQNIDYDILLEYNKKKMLLVEKKLLFNIIKYNIDGDFVLNYLKASPGPWLGEFLEKLYLELLKQTRL